MMKAFAEALLVPGRMRSAARRSLYHVVVETAGIQDDQERQQAETFRIRPLDAGPTRPGRRRAGAQGPRVQAIVNGCAPLVIGVNAKDYRESCFCASPSPAGAV